VQIEGAVLRANKGSSQFATQLEGDSMTTVTIPYNDLITLVKYVAEKQAQRISKAVDEMIAEPITEITKSNDLVEAQDIALWIPSILKTEIGDQYSELSSEYCEKLVQTALKTIPILDSSDATH